MIELRNVSKTYSKGNEDEVKALKNVNLTFNDSGLYFITGKSGSGKSTMLNILGGLDSVSDGQVIVDGECLDTLLCNQLDEYRKNKVGFIFQNFNLIEELSVGENIALALDLKGEKTDIEKIRQALKAVDLDGYEKRKASKLSGGQKQRVAMARALVKSPDIILADEPTGNLDSATSQTIFELLKELSKERLVIVVSHDGESVEKYADTIIECVDGETTLKENNRQEENTISKKTKLNELPSKGMSARNIAKLGLGFALRHKFRLIVTMILVVFALSFIGVAVTMAQSNNVTVEYSNLIANGENIVHLGSKLQPESNLHNVGGETRISNENVKEICDVLPDFKFNKIYYDTRFDGVYEIPEYRENDNFHTSRILGVTALIDDDLTRLGMTMLAGSLPKEKNEVALPAYICDIYLDYGLYNYEKDKEESIESYDAIIGKSYGLYYKIVGVVDTGFDMARYAPLKNISEDLTQEEYDKYVELGRELEYVKSHSIHSSIIVSQYYIDYNYALPTAKVKNGSIAGTRISYVSTLSASSYGNLYTQEEGYQIRKVRDFTTLADDEIIFNRTRLFTTYYNCYGKTPSDEELVDFCLNNKISLQLGEDEEAKEFKIVGIIDDRVNPYPYLAPHLIMSESFLSQYDYQDDIIWSLYTSLSGDKNKDKKLVALSRSYDVDENFYFPIYWSAMEGLDIVYTFVNIIKYFGVGTGVVFLIFTILMIINYISATISSSQKQIGILKALGAGNKELISIFSVEALLIGLIGFVLAIVLSIGWIALCNYIMAWANNVAMGMIVNWLSALAVFGVSAITCVIGSILPIKRLLKKKPIDIINN